MNFVVSVDQMVNCLNISGISFCTIFSGKYKNSNIFYRTRRQLWDTVCVMIGWTLTNRLSWYHFWHTYVLCSRPSLSVIMKWIFHMIHSAVLCKSFRTKLDPLPMTTHSKIVPHWGSWKAIIGRKSCAQRVDVCMFPCVTSNVAAHARGLLTGQTVQRLVKNTFYGSLLQHLSTCIGYMETVLYRVQ